MIKVIIFFFASLFLFSACGIQVRMLTNNSQLARPLPSGLKWTETSPSTQLTVHAQWSRVSSLGLTTQGVQFYSGATCNTAVGLPVSVSLDADTLVWSPPGVGTYSFKVQNSDSLNSLYASACSPALVLQHVHGSLDLTFGTGGMTNVDVAGGADIARDVAIQSDGKIVTAGYAISGGVTRGAVSRLNSDGSIDTSFGTGGTAIFGNQIDEQIFGVKIQPDGKIVATGFSDITMSSADFFVARLNANGSLDPTFGSGGLALIPIGSYSGTAYCMALQADGKIIAAGTANSDGVILRLNTDGTLDSSFGTGGMTAINLSGGADIFKDLLVEPDGKIIAAGNVNNNSDNGVVRFNADGTLDSGFGVSGVFVHSFVAGTDVAESIDLQADGKIVLSGYTATQSILYRLNANGTIDSSFGSSGFTLFSAGINSRSYGLKLLSDGSLISVGYGSNGSNNDIAVTKFTSNGLLDSSFGSAGISSLSFGTGNDQAYGIAIDAQGRIVIAGWGIVGPNSNYALARLWF